MPEPELPAPYMTPEEIRLLFPTPMANDAISDALLEGLVAEFEEMAERFAGQAFTPRERTVTLEIWRASTGGQMVWAVILPDAFISAVTEVTVDGVELTEEELALLTLNTDLSVLSGFSARFGAPAVIAYTYGHAAVPPGVRRACGEYVRAKAIESVGNGPRNAISYSDDSGFSYRDSTADWDAGRPTGIRAVDDVLRPFREDRLPAIA